mmetsp:Transcript_65466/g.188647  ORF Transcript_65466/g.188647 Transcript_65466/m.188647 type:complete len:576 (-) Transcript_65466:213-1940(-)
MSRVIEVRNTFVHFVDAEESAHESGDEEQSMPRGRAVRRAHTIGTMQDGVKERDSLVAGCMTPSTSGASGDFSRQHTGSSTNTIGSLMVGDDMDSQEGHMDIPSPEGCHWATSNPFDASDAVEQDCSPCSVATFDSFNSAAPPFFDELPDDAGNPPACPREAAYGGISSGHDEGDNSIDVTSSVPRPRPSQQEVFPVAVAPSQRQVVMAVPVAMLQVAAPMAPPAAFAASSAEQRQQQQQQHRLHASLSTLAAQPCRQPPPQPHQQQPPPQEQRQQQLRCRQVDSVPRASAATGSACCAMQHRRPDMLSQAIDCTSQQVDPGTVSRSVACAKLPSGGVRIRWELDVRRFAGRDSTVVSPAFMVELPAFGTHRFKVLVHAAAARDKRRGVGFRAASGHGRIELKCDAVVAGTESDTAEGEEYVVMVHKTASARLGLDLASQDGEPWRVKSISAGLVKQWNDGGRGVQVLPGDYIVEANGQRGNTTKVREACAQVGPLRMVLRRGSTAPRRFSISFGIGCGSAASPPWPMRGPVQHSFAEHSCCGLREGDDDFDIPSALCRGSAQVAIYVEVLPWCG